MPKMRMETHHFTEGHAETAQLLVDRGANVDAKNDDDGDTPLHDACREGHPETAQLLVDRGANIDTKNNAKITPLEAARANKSFAVAPVIMGVKKRRKLRSVEDGKAFERDKKFMIEYFKGCVEKNPLDFGHSLEDLPEYERRDAIESLKYSLTHGGFNVASHCHRDEDLWSEMDLCSG